MFTYVIRGLAPETDYEVQVCQPELNVCGNCTVMFTTPAAEGTVYKYKKSFLLNEGGYRDGKL